MGRDHTSPMAHGPEQFLGCACPCSDAFDCVRRRYFATNWEDSDEQIEPCECSCHDEPYDDDEPRP